MTARHFCFTLNNPTPDDCARITHLASLDTVLVLVVGRETADTGTHHLQGHIAFTSPKRFAAVKALISDAIHVEASKAWKASLTYCRKDGDMLIDIDKRSQGKRTDLDVVADALLSGSSTRAVALDHPSTYIKYHSGIERLSRVIQPSLVEFTSTTVLVLLGPTGCGKTRYCTSFNPFRVSLPSTDLQPLWFDGYAAEDSILLDDYRGSIDYALLLHITDGYPLSVPVKGGFVRRNWSRVFITSNVMTISEWHPTKDLEPLSRRISKIHDMWHGDPCPSHVLVVESDGSDHADL